MKPVNRRSEIDVMFVTGPPGAGKTSMAMKYQNENQHVEQFGNGDLIRDLRTRRVCSAHGEIIHRAAQNHELLPDDIFAGAFYEKVMGSRGDTKTMFITGFPYARGDWEHFHEKIRNTNGVRTIGAIALYASIQTCVDRMQKRDMQHSGVSSSDVYTEQAIASYKERYSAHLARSATRLDCFHQSDIGITFISAEEPLDSVFDNFTYAVNNFQKIVRAV